MLEGGFNMTNNENKMSHEEAGRKGGKKTA